MISRFIISFCCALMLQASHASGQILDQGFESQRSQRSPWSLRMPPGQQGNTSPGVLVEYSVQDLQQLKASDGPVVLSGFPLARSRSVDLIVERFSVTTDQTRFVMRSAAAHEQDLAFDPESIVLLRGAVLGEPRSHVFLAISDLLCTGSIDLGSSSERFGVSDRGLSGEKLAGDLVSVFPAHAVSGGLGVPMCGVDEEGSGFIGGGGRGVLPLDRIKQIEMAIETDWDLAILFDAPEEEAAYITVLYAAISDIYLRDVRTRLVLNFVRLWDTPSDMFNGENPLSELRDEWFANMGNIERDAVQMLSGRRDLPWGGVAFGTSLCNPEGAYSFSGYTLGSFPDPSSPSVFSRDLVVPAHELGHNTGAPHTHNVGIDTCNDGLTPPRRGTIMSYCGQTFSGGDGNTDLRFHTGIVALMRTTALTFECIANDDNGNGIDDAIDIANGTSEDVNLNGVPDEAEDCNSNGVLDDIDINNGTSLDLNGNGRPDECEPDCNTNSVPDDLDIANGTETDENGDGVPDSCEPDCDGDGRSDYTQIQEDITLDLDRNTVLDGCQDCDGDGIGDLDALAGANDVWMCSTEGTGMRRYLATTGTFVCASENAGIQEGQDVLVVPDGRVLVSSRLDSRIAVFDYAGASLGDLVPSGSGGLLEPAAMVLRPDGRLLVASRGTNSILEFDSANGDFLGVFIAPGSGGLVAPFGLAFGPGGDIFVTSDDGRVLRYDGVSGAFVSEFVTLLDNGGLLAPRGLMFLPDGDLLVSSYGTDQVLQYDRLTGAFVEEFSKIGTPANPLLEQPWAIRMGPDGMVHVSRAHGNPGERPEPDQLHLTNARIYIFDPTNGYMLRSYVQGVDSGIEFSTGFDFLPAMGLDCNQNLMPDSCDIANGTSLDLNENGIPDECEAGTTCIADFSVPFGILDFFDVQAFLGAFSIEDPSADLNADGVFDFFDLQEFLAAFAAGCP